MQDFYIVIYRNRVRGIVIVPKTEKVETNQVFPVGTKWDIFRQDVKLIMCWGNKIRLVLKEIRR